MGWPWRRFEAFYSAFIVRRVLESLERRKEQMISALWANSNYDDDKETRKKAIAEIEDNFEQAARSVRGQKAPDEEPAEEQFEIDDNNPFFAASKRGLARIEAPRNDEGTVADAIYDNVP